VVVLRNIKVLDAIASKWGRVTLRLSDGLNRQNFSGFNLSSRIEEVGPNMDLAMVFEPESSGYDATWKILDFRAPVY
jgi:hypothetical protein